MSQLTFLFWFYVLDLVHPLLHYNAFLKVLLLLVIVLFALLSLNVFFLTYYGILWLYHFNIARCMWVFANKAKYEEKQKTGYLREKKNSEFKTIVENIKINLVQPKSILTLNLMNFELCQIFFFFLKLKHPMLSGFMSWLRFKFRLLNPILSKSIKDY